MTSVRIVLLRLSFHVCGCPCLALVLTGGIAASCGGSNGSGQLGGDAGREGGMVSCGGAGEACCNGAACDNGLTCGTAGTCTLFDAGDVRVNDATASSSGDVAVADAYADATEDSASPEAAGGDSLSGGPCKAGAYKGPFSGNYSSHLTGIGIPIPVTGTVDMMLAPEASAQATCMLAGEVRACSDLLSIQSGTITAVGDPGVGDSGASGFPIFCTMTGTLDCANKKLVNGWLQCTYCVGPLADGGMACTLLNGVGEYSAGLLTADYDYDTVSFAMGAWNVADVLAGNDGGSPGPDGGPPSNYLSDSGYVGAGNFGGSGTWKATHP